MYFNHSDDLLLRERQDQLRRDAERHQLARLVRPGRQTALLRWDHYRWVGAVVVVIVLFAVFSTNWL